MQRQKDNNNTNTLQEVALVLSSGGARGVTQIGVIEALEKSGYRIHSIAGSSIGAVVGGIYASGYLSNYKKWLCNLDKLDVFNLMDFSFSAQGLIKGERVFKEMEKILSDCAIEDLKINFRAVATDIINKKPYIFDKGSLFEAMRASVAIPTVLRPLFKNKLTLLDGGVINPLPIDVVKRKPNDILVVVNVNAAIPYKQKVPMQKEEVKQEKEYQDRLAFFRDKILKLLPKQEQEQEKKLGFFDLLTESIDIMQDKISSQILSNHNPDIVVNISKDIAGTFEFYRSESLIKEGYETFMNIKQMETETKKAG